MRPHLLLLVVLVCALFGGCGGGRTSSGREALPGLTPTAGPAPLLPLADNPLPTADPANIALLQAELMRHIGNAPPVYHPPQTEDTRVRLELSWAYPQSDRALQIQWNENLPGDLDLNGRVDAADLIPLSNYLGSYEHDLLLRLAWNNAAPDYFRHLDADSNGVIGPSDVRIIGQHYGEALDGYLLYRRVVDTGTWQKVPHPDDPASPMTLRRIDAQADPVNWSGLKPLVFCYLDAAYPAPSVEYRAVPYWHGATSHEGLSSFPAAFRTDDHAGEGVPLEVPAAVKVGEPSELVQYAQPALGVYLQIDVDADGTYEYYGTDMAPVLTLQREGLNFVRVTVIDGEDVAYQEYEIRAELEPPPAATPSLTLIMNTADNLVPFLLKLSGSEWSDANPGYQLEVTLTMPDGSRGEIWRDGQSIRLGGDYTVHAVATKYGAEALTWSGSFTAFDPPPSTWQLVEIAGVQGRFSATMVGGRPAVARWGYQSADYIRANDDSGLSWPALASHQTIDLDDADAEGWALLDANGRPAIHAIRAEDVNNSIQFFVQGNFYTVALDDMGSAWSPLHEFVHTVGEYSHGGCMAIVDGRPAIGFVTDDGSGHAYALYARALDDYGLSWPDLVATPVSYSQFSCLTDSASRQPLLFSAGTELVLRDQPGSPPASDEPVSASFGWRVIQQDFVEQRADGSLVLVLDAGRAEGIGPRGVHLLSSLDGEGRVWSPILPGPADVRGVEPYVMNVACVGNRIGIAYYDAASYRLLYVQSADKYGAAWKEPEIVDQQGMIQAGRVQLLDVHGKPGIVYARQDAGLMFGTP